MYKLNGAIALVFGFVLFNASADWQTAMDALEAGQCDVAIEHFRERVANSPDDADAWLMVARSEDCLGNTDAALDAIERRIEGEPSVEIIDLVDAMLEKDLEPDDRERSLNFLGDAYVALGRPGAAVAAYREAENWEALGAAAMLGRNQLWNAMEHWNQAQIDEEIEIQRRRKEILDAMALLGCTNCETGENKAESVEPTPTPTPAA